MPPPPPPVFIDTWGWLALGNHRETKHTQIKQYYETLQTQNTQIYTTDYVLDELITLLFRRESFQDAVRFIKGILHSANQGDIFIERITAHRFASAWQLRQQYQDKPDISFTDFISMSVMMERKIRKVLTEDHHFLTVGKDFQLVP